MAAKYFGEAEVTVAPGLYFNPTDLKSARRDLLASFEAAWDLEVTSRAARIETWLRENATSLDPRDADLLAGGPAAVSRVTGLQAGEIFTQTGHRFELIPGSSGTRVMFKSKG